jgi:hypothetical protein
MAAAKEESDAVWPVDASERKFYMLSELLDIPENQTARGSGALDEGRTRYTKAHEGVFIVTEGVRDFVDHVVSNHLHPRIQADVRVLLGSDAPCVCGNTNFSDTDEKMREGKACLPSRLGAWTRRRP